MRHNQRELNIIAERKRFVDTLRTFPEARHCLNTLISPYGNNKEPSFCAIGLYLYMCSDWNPRGGGAECYIKSRLGLSRQAVREMASVWNDALRLTFVEIADKFEAVNFPIIINDTRKR